MEAVGTWNVPTPLEEVHQDLETKERKKQLFYYHQANAAVNALGARVTEGASPPRNPCMCASGAGADRAPPPRNPCTCCSRGRAGSSCAPCCARRLPLPRRPHTTAACRRRCPRHHSPTHIGYARPVTGLRPGRPRHGHCFLVKLSLSLSLSLFLSLSRAGGALLSCRGRRRRRAL